MDDDVALAIEDVQRAADTLSRITLLPRRPGATVKWGHNGLVWRRVHANGWAPVQTPPAKDVWPSSHIAMFDFDIQEF